jgi:hypothetical protein
MAELMEKILEKEGDLVIPIPPGGGEKNKGKSASKPKTRWNDPTRKWDGKIGD